MMKLSMMHGLCYHIWVRQTVFLLVVHSHHTTQKIWHNSLLHLLQHEGFFLEMLMWPPQGILTVNIILSDRGRCSCLFVSLWFAISRWHTIRSPKLWQAEQSFRSNKVNSITKPYNVLCNYQNDVWKISMLILNQFLIPYTYLFMVLRTCLLKSICSYILHGSIQMCMFQQFILVQC